MLTMAAAMGFRSPFFCPIDKREEADKARKAFATGHSDLLTTLKAYDGWQVLASAPTVTPHRQYTKEKTSSPPCPVFLSPSPYLPRSLPLFLARSLLSLSRTRSNSSSPPPMPLTAGRPAHKDARVTACAAEGATDGGVPPLVCAFVCVCVCVRAHRRTRMHTRTCTRARTHTQCMYVCAGTHTQIQAEAQALHACARARASRVRSRVRVRARAGPPLRRVLPETRLFAPANGPLSPPPAAPAPPARPAPPRSPEPVWHASVLTR